MRVGIVGSGSDKIGVIHNLLEKVDSLLIGGGMANTFFKAQGKAVEESLVENDKLEEARTLISKADSKLILPVDVVVADRMDTEAQKRTVSVDAVPAGWRILDIGPESVKRFTQYLRTARTVVWNGPMGVFELGKGNTCWLTKLAHRRCWTHAAIRQSRAVSFSKTGPAPSRSCLLELQPGKGGC